VDKIGKLGSGDRISVLTRGATIALGPMPTPYFLDVGWGSFTTEI
jgi:hypothetical protein